VTVEIALAAGVTAIALLIVVGLTRRGIWLLGTRLETRIRYASRRRTVNNLRTLLDWLIGCIWWLTLAALIVVTIWLATHGITLLWEDALGKVTPR